MGSEAVVFALQDHQGRKIGIRIEREFTKSTSYIVRKELEICRLVCSYLSYVAIAQYVLYKTTCHINLLAGFDFTARYPT
jgi:hypothetical protein